MSSSCQLLELLNADATAQSCTSVGGGIEDHEQNEAEAILDVHELIRTPSQQVVSLENARTRRVLEVSFLCSCVAPCRNRCVHRLLAFTSYVNFTESWMKFEEPSESASKASSSLSILRREVHFHRDDLLPFVTRTVVQQCSPLSRWLECHAEFLDSFRPTATASSNDVHAALDHFVHKVHVTTVRVGGYLLNQLIYEGMEMIMKNFIFILVA